MNKNAKSWRITRKLAIAGVLFGCVSAVYAAPALVQIGVGGCSMLDGNGTQLFSSDPKLKVKVSTQSTNHTLTLTCELANVPNDTGRAVIYNAANTDGGQCMISDPLRGNEPRPADVWHQLVSASGQAILTCMTHTP
ncbi:hypothetical protein EGT07_21065 [Herbaspirillum sp. HC18]|nr:hypothetical protein EGT07_21065 [Herbaspirillum sp. HC18]